MSKAWEFLRGRFWTSSKDIKLYVENYESLDRLKPSSFVVGYSFVVSIFVSIIVYIAALFPNSNIEVEQGLIILFAPILVPVLFLALKKYRFALFFLIYFIGFFEIAVFVLFSINYISSVNFRVEIIAGEFLGLVTVLTFFAGLSWLFWYRPCLTALRIENLRKKQELYKKPKIKRDVFISIFMFAVFTGLLCFIISSRIDQDHAREQKLIIEKDFVVYMTQEEEKYFNENKDNPKIYKKSGRLETIKKRIEAMTTEEKEAFKELIKFVEELNNPKIIKNFKKAGYSDQDISEFREQLYNDIKTLSLSKKDIEYIRKIIRKLKC